MSSGVASVAGVEPPSRRPGAAEMPLALRGVRKRWHRSQAPVLVDVDLDVDLGTRTWVGGRNGAGKTTLLRIAAGLIDPDAGSAQSWGTQPGEDRRRWGRLISFLPAGDRGLYARLTVRRQLEFWARIALVPAPELGPAVDRAIADFELEELACRRVDRMSMGQRQRLRIAMTFLAGPEVVLLDEPLTSLDGEGAELLDRAIDRLVEAGGAMLWCSPAGERIDHPFDAAYILERGRLVPA